MYDMHDPHIYIFTTDPSPSFITQSSKSFFIGEKIQISAKRFGFFGSKTVSKDCVPLLRTPALLLLFPGHETGDAKLMFLQAN
jgi:hypothetical protein